jgi:hypothetical protein
MTPNKLIENTISKLTTKYSDILALIDIQLKYTNYLGGDLKVDLDFEIDSQCFKDLQFIYRHRGWTSVCFLNKVINKKGFTCIHLNNIADL